MASFLDNLAEPVPEFWILAAARDDGGCAMTTTELLRHLHIVCT